ncbi:MAG: putative sulfate/molybdate transporter [Rhizobacter sp.]|nr:putative sulfate/molybdate transporter [Chlorobiales bacterium]
MNTRLPVTSPIRPRIRFNRRELGGAFGDMGTDFPLLVGMVAAASLDACGVLVLFGLMQIFTGWMYRMPMPVQPLKAVAVIVITQKIGGDILIGGGLAIGLVMLALALTGALDMLSRLVPKPVVRGLQLGLGLQLATLALTNYIKADGLTGYVLAAVIFIMILLLTGNHRVPAALVAVVIGIGYAVVFKPEVRSVMDSIAVRVPQVAVPSMENIGTGFLLLALPQIALSLGNSVLATKQVAEDFFPERKLGVRQIGLTYSAMNIVSAFFGGVPVCHGSSGMVGHLAFGARTGGSVIIYGLFYLVLGLFFSNGFETIVKVFPLPVLGVLLLFEAVALISLMKDTAAEPHDFPVAVLTGLLANGLPYGFLIALITCPVIYFWVRNNKLRLPG